VLVLGFSAVSAPADAAETPAGGAQMGEKDVVLRGDAACTRCHDEEEEYPVLSIGKTKHGTVVDGRTPTCTSCHGESDTHANKPEDAVERPAPDISYGRGSPTPMPARDETCIGCHQSGVRIHWAGSIHAARDVGCTSCHQVHTGHDRVRDKRTQPEVCISCHKEQRVQLMRPSRHPILEGKVACSDCHDSHGSIGPTLMVRDTVNDTCYECHMDKRGPFLRAHQPVTENCAICHNPHGTIHSAMLKTRAPFLCQQCHEPTGHRGTAANLSPRPPNSTFGTNTLGRGCLNCHTSIHGTNNPLDDDDNTRTFRR
jgi:DmsE family decaheme c-type cytochrome